MRKVGTALAALVIAALLTACGGISHPAGGRGVIDDQRTGQGAHLQCLRTARLPAVTIGQTEIQVGQAPSGPLIDYQATPGAAQAVQLTGHSPGAEVIGAALLYPNQGSDHELSIIEKCLSNGVKG